MRPSKRWFPSFLICANSNAVPGPPSKPCFHRPRPSPWVSSPEPVVVAGWDHLLPVWFTRLHAKYRTPVNSILFLGGIAIATSIVVLAGVGDQEAFELLQIWGFTFYGLAYLALFAIPLLAQKERGTRPGLWLRIAAASGFFVTLLFVLLSIFPIISVKSESAYAIKTAAVLIGANALGLLFYRLGSGGRPRPKAA